MNTVGHDALIVESLGAAALAQLVEQPHGQPLGRLHLHWPTEAATQAWAAQLALLPALQSAIVELHGELGAGKTTLVRHLLRALGVQGRIKSPSYAVMEPHVAVGAAQAIDASGAGSAGGDLAISHFDFYRFNDPREWEDAGFRDVFSAPGLKLLEWPDKARAALPVPDLAIHISVDADGSRSVLLLAHSACGLELLACA